jgi:hypothetical protein
MEHLLENNLLRQSQHRFMSKKCCTINLLEILETMISGRSHGHCVPGFFQALQQGATQEAAGQLGAHAVGGKVLKWIGS